MVSSSLIQVQKKNGKVESYQVDKITSFFQKIVPSKTDVIEWKLLINKVNKQIFDGITTTQISKILILTTVGFIEKDPFFDTMTTQLLLNKIYREVFGRKINSENFSETYRKTWIENLRQIIEREKQEHQKNQKLLENTQFLQKASPTAIAKVREKVKRGVKTNPRLLDFDLGKLSHALVLERDNSFNYLGLETLYSRYFWRKEKQILETPQTFWMRIAMGLSLNETNKNEKAIEFYHLMSTFRFVPSTPTLFHSGLTRPQLSSCFLTTVEDDLDHIFKTYWDTAKMLKYSGGVANDWSNLRASNSLVRSISNAEIKASGLIPPLKEMNDTVIFVSGQKRGAVVAYVEVWHLEIEDFLNLRQNVGSERRRTHDLNLAAWIPDLFMKRVREGKEWTLFSPNETSDLHHLYGKNFEEKYQAYEQQAQVGEIKLFKKISALTLWKKMLTRLFETGYPWITFKDSCNVRSPQDHVGVVHCSNLCTEITLNTSKEEIAVCNLGSVNLSKHIVNNKLDEKLLKETVLIAMRMLDNVIDINDYSMLPKETENSNLKHRPVGLGMMGFQDALFKLDISFDSPKALRFTNEVTEKYSYYAILGSCQLAKERGTYSSYKGSKWDRGIFPFNTLALLEKERGEKIVIEEESTMDWQGLKEQVKEFGMRNSNTMAIAPTATIANIAGCYPCIEPIYSNLYTKSNAFGEFVVVNKYLVNDLKKIGQWNQDVLNQIKYQGGSIQNIHNIPQKLKDKYKGVFELNPLWLIKITAERGQWIDQSISHNVFYQGVSGKDLSKIYFTAWEMGLKTTYYLRTLGASQVEKSTLDADKFGYTQRRDNKSPQVCSNEEDCESCQ